MHLSLAETIFAIVNFGLLLLLLRLFLYKPISKMLAERQNTIAESLAQAEQARTDALAAKDQIAAQIEQANLEAETIIAKATQNGEQLKKQILAEARQEAQAIQAKTQADLDRYREEIRHNLQQEAVALAIKTAGQILAEEINQEKQKSLLNSYIKRLGQLS